MTSSLSHQCILLPDNDNDTLLVSSLYTYFPSQAKSSINLNLTLKWPAADNLTQTTIQRNSSYLFCYSLTPVPCKVFLLSCMAKLQNKTLRTKPSLVSSIKDSLIGASRCWTLITVSASLNRFLSVWRRSCDRDSFLDLYVLWISLHLCSPLNPTSERNDLAVLHANLSWNRNPPEVSLWL